MGGKKSELPCFIFYLVVEMGFHKIQIWVCLKKKMVLSGLKVSAQMKDSSRSRSSSEAKQTGGDE